MTAQICVYTDLATDHNFPLYSAKLVARQGVYAYQASVCTLHQQARAVERAALSKRSAYCAHAEYLKAHPHAICMQDQQLRM